VIPAFFRGETCGCSGMVFDGSCNDILLDKVKNIPEKRKYFDFSYINEQTQERREEINSAIPCAD
jgi:hypothetical protein